jgi:hypothetical protein
VNKLAAILLLVLALPPVGAQLSPKEQRQLYESAANEHVREATAKKRPNALLSREAVPSEDIATQIHAAVASSVFGKEHIESQRPFKAVRSGRFWVVFGTLTPPSLGGTAVTVIRASNGEVLRVLHEQ